MDKKNFESLLKKYPDCVSDGKKLKAFLTDLYPDVPKAIVNTLTIMADDGIISEMQKAGQTQLVSARLQKKLEDDYGLSQKIISECFSLIIYDNAKQTKSAINAGTHEKNTSFIDTQPTFALRKEVPQKLDILQPEYDPKDFEIENGTLKKYKGRSSVVVIPNSVTSIGSSAFSGCSGLTSITISDSVTSIGDYAFGYCWCLTSITIPDSVTSIGSSAFRNCSGLTSVTIGNSVTSIGSSAFEGCTGLTSITIPDSVTSIGYSAFEVCTGLTSITVADGNSKYHSSGNCIIETSSKILILGCKTSVIPSDGSVTSIGSSAFAGCTGLTSITIPDSVTSIGGSAFQRCTGLTSIAIPNGVTSIGDSAFWGCRGLTSVTIPDSVTNIGDYAFSGTGLTSVTIPDSVTSIGDEAFSSWRNLTIYCEAKSKPIGWSSYWNPGHRPVVWGVKK